MRTTLLLLPLLLTLGCQSNPDSSPPMVETSEIPHYREAPYFSGSLVAVPQGMLLPSIDNSNSHLMVAPAQLYDVYHAGDSWPDRHVRVRAYRDSVVQSNPAIPFFFIDQATSITMLGNAIMQHSYGEDPIEWNEANKAILAEHIEVLVQHENPQAVILMLGLELLEGHWPAHRLQESALIAAAAAESYMTSDQSHLHPGVKEIIGKTHHPLIKQAVADLRTFAAQQSP